ncbi:MAG: hypothetical protein AB7J28_12900 [Hyphomonadaceae bacterium]
MTRAKTHSDGSLCPEGTQSLPSSGAICCDAFGWRTLACYFDIRYEFWENPEGWFVIIQPDAGGGGILLSYCPHCGAKLPGELEPGRYMNMSGLEFDA